MSLVAYRKKRNFRKTPEPAGTPKAGSRHPQLHYVIQKHDASHLHYDFRLELDGTLKSWAVPKGPSLDPARKALAVQVEDHPLSYEQFEGTIPKGEYGEGTVMLWDRGTWEPLENPREGFKKGKLRFALHGQKLHGQWSLVRMGGRQGAAGKNWLLIKARDAYSTTRNILDESPESVKTRRSLAQIAAGEKAHGGNGKAAPAKAASAKAAPGAGGLPTVAPQLAVLVDHPPAGDEWVHEIKFDGYRLLAHLNKGDVTLRTRTGQDWTARFPLLPPALQQIRAESAIIDGEAVVLNAEGRSDFQLLQSSFKARGPVDLHYFVFDLLYLDGHDLRALPLLERKDMLQRLLEASGSPARIDWSEYFDAAGETVIHKVCALGFEGIISKRRTAPYISGRDPSWVKSKCAQGQEFVILGYAASDKRPDGIRSLLLGYYDADHQLVYCGRVGTGFDAVLRRGLLAKLRALEQARPPLAQAPSRREQLAGHWVRPELVCEVRFEGWTRDGSLRQPAFIALRQDKPAEEIVRETPRHVVRGRVKAAPASTAEKNAVEPSPRVNGHTRAAAAPSHGPPPGAGPWQNLGVRVTHPERLAYPVEGLTKADLADYVVAVAPLMLPHVVDRPLALVRCPAGLAQKPRCFFMRNWSETLPPDIHPIRVGLGADDAHVMIHDLKGLVSLVQISALEIHTWNCTAADVDHPDQIVFDLDPGEDVTWKTVVHGARALREMLIGLTLTPFLKTSGGKGLHLTVPIEPTVTWQEAKALCRTIAQYAAQEDELFLARMSKAVRRGHIFVDYLRNDKGSTAVAPYSTRARPGATVSMPLAWEQLDAVASGGAFTVANARAHLARRQEDPWKDFNRRRVDLRQVLQQSSASAPEE